MRDTMKQAMCCSGGMCDAEGSMMVKPGSLASTVAHLPAAAVLDETNISENGLAAIANLPHLEELVVQECEIERLDCFWAPNFPRLRHLVVSRLGEHELVALRQARPLLYVSCGAKAATVEHFQRVVQSFQADMSETEFDEDHVGRSIVRAFTDAQVGTISRLFQLELLRLDSTRVTAAGLRKLSALCNLADLSLHRMPISDEALEALMCLPRLAKLDLAGFSSSP
jgi:hypothetical protein